MEYPKEQRKVYIDFLKIISIYMVLYNHTGINGFLLFTTERNTNWYLFYLFSSIFIKIAVPLFFMCSGALLLGKEESYKDLLVKRFLKYLFVLFIGSIIAYLYTCLRWQSEELSIKAFLKRLYTSRLTVAYWYLYAYLAYILMLPLLRKMAKDMTDKEYKWMFLMYGLIKLLSILDFLIWKGETGYNTNFSFFILSDNVFFPLMGYYIDQRMPPPKFTLKNLLILCSMSIAAITVCSWLTHYKCTLTGEWGEGPSQAFFKTLIFIPSITVYYAVKMWFMKHELSEKMQSIIVNIGETTFGIYLIEQICRDETEFVIALLEPYINKFPACCIWVLVACIGGGGVIVWLVRRIPIFRKFI